MGHRRSSDCDCVGVFYNARLVEMRPAQDMRYKVCTYSYSLHQLASGRWQRLGENTRSTVKNETSTAVCTCYDLRALFDESDLLRKENSWRNRIVKLPYESEGIQREELDILCSTDCKCIAFGVDSDVFPTEESIVHASTCDQEQRATHITSGPWRVSMSVPFSL